MGIQYRVASLAFLYFDTEDVPGNAGILSTSTLPTVPNSQIPKFVMYGYLCSNAGQHRHQFLLKSELFSFSGMFDQLMALQWVKDNIEQFGAKNLTKSCLSQGDQLQLFTL